MPCRLTVGRTHVQCSNLAFFFFFFFFNGTKNCLPKYYMFIIYVFFF